MSGFGRRSIITISNPPFSDVPNNFKLSKRVVFTEVLMSEAGRKNIAVVWQHHSTALVST